MCLGYCACLLLVGISVGLLGTASGTVTAAGAGAFVGRGRGTRILGEVVINMRGVEKRLGIGGA